MRLVLIDILFVLIAAVSSAHADELASSTRGDCTPPTLSSLNVTLRPQLTENWCWAASAQMVMEYLGKKVSQCEQVNAEYNLAECCNNPTKRECIKGGWPEFDKHGFTYSRTASLPLSWLQIQSQLAPRDVVGHCKFTPFAFTWHYPGGSGHMMVAIGYKTENGKNLLQIIDPLPVGAGGSRFITYSEYVGIDGNTHWDDFYEIK